MNKNLESKQWSIYYLLDPITNEVRYVGFATDAKKRLRYHIKEAKRKSGATRATYKTRWIQSLLRKELSPLIVVVEQGTGDEWIAAEKKWIAHFRSMGCRLTNATDGGEGTLGWRPNESQRAKMAERMKGNKHQLGWKASDEVRQKKAEFMKGNQHLKGHKHSEETRAKLKAKRAGKTPALGLKHSEETKVKLAEIGRRNGIPPDQLKKMRAARSGKPLTEKELLHIERLAAVKRGKPSHPNSAKALADALKRQREERRKNQLPLFGNDEEFAA